MKWIFYPLVLFWSIGMLSAQNTVSGTVTSGTENEPLIGANIIVKGTSIGTVTDLDGNFILEVPSLDDTLQLSYTGYQNQEVPIAGRAEVNIQMYLSSELLDEVIVVGYGTQKKSDVTGAVARVSGDEISNIPTASVTQALQGKIAGVFASPVSGEPGASAVVRIRGTGTLNNNSPLFVVDGLITENIDFLNPNDIETIDVLKDASAQAIYGAQGANGVIIITTKTGEIGKKTQFSFNAYYGFQEVENRIELANAREFAQLANETAINEGRSPLYTEEEVQSFGEGTDWQDEAFQTAPIQNYQLSAIGGTDKISYSFSGNYFRQEGVVKQSEFERITFRLNNTYQLADIFKLGHNIAFIREDRVNAPNVIGNTYRAWPTIAPRDSAGNFNDTSPVGNLAASFEFNNNEAFTNRVVGTVFGELNLFKYFYLRTQFSGEFSQGENKSFTPVFFVSPNQQNDESRIFVNFDRSQKLVWDNTLTFRKEFGDHNVEALFGVTAQEFENEFINGARLNVPDEAEEFWFLSAGSAEGQTNANLGGEWSIFSILARVNYSFKGRYLLTLNFRRDGSSRFGRENRYGNFPSFSVGWNLTNENFMASQSVLSRMKLRLGFGIIGNDRALGFYPAQATISPNQNAIFGPGETLNLGSTLTSLANPQLKWEETSQWNLGIEFGFLQNRLTGELDLYTRETSDILIAVPIPDYVGSEGDPVVNAADVRNRGVDLSLNWTQAGRFSYNVGVVFSYVDNEVLSLGQGNEQLIGGALGVGGKTASRTVPGLPIGAFYGFQTDGIFQTEDEIANSPTLGNEVPGDLRFVDVDGDGVITTEDRTFLGSPIPTTLFGLNAGFQYVGIDFLIEFNGQAGNKIVNAKKAARFGTFNYEDSYLARWTGEGTSNTEPRVTNGGHNYNMSDWLIEDGGFVRLRNITLGYTLPFNITSRIGIERLRIYASGTNLVTWTEFNGFNPEIFGTNPEDPLSVGVDRLSFPIPRVYTFGIDLSF